MSQSLVLNILPSRLKRFFSTACVLIPWQDVALFKEGLPANDAIKVMAEDGDNSALLVQYPICCIFVKGGLV